MGNPGKQLNIQHRQGRIGNGLPKHGLGIVLKSGIQLRFIRIRGNECYINAHLLHGNGNQVIGAAIDGR